MRQAAIGLDETKIKPTLHWVGLGVFLLGMMGNIHSDSILRGLRGQGGQGGHQGYKIPHGGLFQLISAPNYSCESIEWAGFAAFIQVTCFKQSPYNTYFLDLSSDIC